MNAQEGKDYLQGQLPDMVIEVEENYSNKHATNATRYIFTKGELKTNLMFKQGFKLDTEVLSGVVDAIRKKFEAAPAKAKMEQAKEEVEQLAPEPKPETKTAPAPVAQADVSYAFYLAAKHVVETYEREHPMT